MTTPHVPDEGRRRLQALQLAAPLVAEAAYTDAGDLAQDVLDVAQRFDDWLRTGQTSERARRAVEAREELAEWERQHAEDKAAITGAERSVITAAKRWRNTLTTDDDQFQAVDDLIEAVDALTAAETRTTA